MSFVGGSLELHPFIVYLLMDGSTKSRTNDTGWSPEKELWAELERLSADQSWTKVTLDRNRSHLVSDSDPGVYLIGAAPPPRILEKVRVYAILYAGQVKTRNLRTRFLEHIRRPNPKLKLFLDCFYPNIHFWFTTASDPSRIDALESLLIQTFNPPCNSIKAPGTRVLLARLGSARIIGTKRPHTT